MFSILVVDDEILTRTGIIEGIPWSKLGIDRIMQADDGTSGLKVALQSKPDIVLTDIRMPCMGGIEMSMEIRKAYPECKIVFMSGYSDKEYLMSAIRLKASEYIEKPIDRNALMRAITEVVEVCRTEKENMDTEIAIKKKADMGLTSLMDEFAIHLISTDMDEGLINNCLNSSLFDIKAGDSFRTVLVRFLCEEYAKDSVNISLRKNVIDKLQKLLFIRGYKGITAFKDNSLLVAHIAQDNCRSTEQCAGMYNVFKELCASVGWERYFICIGERVTGINSIPQSYAAALDTLQRTFFHEYGSVLASTEYRSDPFVFDDQILNEFVSLLDKGERYKIEHFLHGLTTEIYLHDNTPVNGVKDVFFRFTLALEKQAQKYGLITIKDRMDKDYLWSTFAGFSTLNDMLTFLEGRINGYFNHLNRLKSERSCVAKVMEYIQENYMHEYLSVKEISEITYLSPAYLCTYFKHETGLTINQYITEYRLDKAKELLKVKGNHISEVAKMVGYSDGNYFTKIFKKRYDMTPSDYRERVIL